MVHAGVGANPDGLRILTRKRERFSVQTFFRHVQTCKWRAKDVVISDAAVGHTLVDIVVANPTRHDLVEHAARQDLVGATAAEQRKETHY